MRVERSFDRKFSLNQLVVFLKKKRTNRDTIHDSIMCFIYVRSGSVLFNKHCDIPWNERYFASKINFSG